MAQADSSPNKVLRNILVPVDGHAASFRALHHALYIARHTGHGQVSALFVAETVPPMLLDDAALVASVQPETFVSLGERVLHRCEEVARKAEAEAEAEAEAGTESGTPGTGAGALRTVLKQGDAAEAILQAAGSGGADVVVMGTHGRKGFERLLLGSVTETVLRAAAVPILALRFNPAAPHAAPAYRRILVPFDGSAPSEHALRFVVPFARAFAASLTLLHIVDNRPGLFGRPPNTADTDAAAQRALEWASAQSSQLGVQAKIVHMVTAKHPAEAIHEMEKDHDLICMGSRGLTGVKRLLLGSVTEAVLRIADHPVLVVHLNSQTEADVTADAASA